MKAFFRGLMENYLPLPSIRLKTEYPDILGISSYLRAGGKEIIIHAVSKMAEFTGGDAVPVLGGRLFLSEMLGKVREVSLVYPDDKELAVEEVENGVEIELPGFVLHQIVRVRL